MVLKVVVNVIIKESVASISETATYSLIYGRNFKRQKTGVFYQDLDLANLLHFHEEVNECLCILLNMFEWFLW